MAFGDFFGGGSTSTTAPSTVYGKQEPFLQDLWGRAQMASYGGQGTDFANQISQGALGGYGQMLGGGFQDPGLQQGLQGFGAQQGAAYQPLQQGLQGFGAQQGQAYQPLQQGLQGFGGMQNQALGGAIQAGLGDISRNFQQNIMPGINMGAALTGTAGGSRQGIAQGLAAQGANRQASDFVARMQSQNWAQQMQNQLGAYGQMGNILGQQGQQQLGAYGQMGNILGQQGQQQLGAFGQMGGLQAQQNLAQQAGMGMAPQMQNLGFGAQYGNLQNLAGLIGSPTVLGGGGQTTQQGGIGSSLGGLANMGALGYIMSSAGPAVAASDRRLKHNIKRIGTTPGGNAWYSFNYLWSDEPMQGVMADEVDPAITIDIGGFKAVDYSRVT